MFKAQLENLEIQTFVRNSWKLLEVLLWEKIISTLYCLLIYGLFHYIHTAVVKCVSMFSGYVEGKFSLELITAEVLIDLVTHENTLY